MIYTGVRTSDSLVPDSSPVARVPWSFALEAVLGTVEESGLVQRRRRPRRRHSRTQSPSYARSTERDKGLWPNPYQTGI